MSKFLKKHITTYKPVSYKRKKKYFKKNECRIIEFRIFAS